MKRWTIMMGIAVLLVGCQPSGSKAVTDALRSDGINVETIQETKTFEEAKDIIRVDEGEIYYDACVNYLCFLYKKDPERAKEAKSIERNGYKDIQEWHGEGYTMRSLTKDDDAHFYEWEWDDTECENFVRSVLKMNNYDS